MAGRQLSLGALEQGRQLWEQSRRSTDVVGFEAVRRWAAANPCGESERLLAKLCLQIAVNRMLSWAKDSLPQVLHSTADDRAQAQLNLDVEAVTLFNTALEAAVRGACNHQSLQCFYLACLLAFWVRGRATAMQIMFRTPLLVQLDTLWQRWDAARRSGARPWADPAEERVIGERAPFEAESKYVSQWLPKALALAPKKLADAIQDERMVLEHLQTFMRPPEPRSSDPRDIVHEPSALLPLRLSQMSELVPSEERQRYAALLAQGDMKLRSAGIGGSAGGGKVVSGVKEQQHRLGQALKLQHAQERLRDAAQRRQLEQQQRQEAEAAATAAGRGAGSSGGAGTSVAVAAGSPADRPMLDDIRRFLERRLEQSSSSAAASSAASASSGSGSGSKKGRSKRAASGAIQQAGEALQQLTRVSPAQLAAAAADFEQQGAVSHEVSHRVQALSKRLAGVAGTDRAAQLSYRWPPPAPPAAASAAARGAARPGKGGAQQAQQAQQGRQAVQFEAPNPAALASFLEGKYLAPDSPGMPQLKQALCNQLPGLQPLLEAMPAAKPRTQQVLRGTGIAELPLKVPAPGDVKPETGLTADTAFVKAVLRGGQPSPRTLLEVLRVCAPAVKPQDEPLLADLADQAGGGGSDRSGGKAAADSSAADSLFFSDEDQHLKAHFTPLDYHAFKSNELWMPVAEGAIGTRRFFGHCSDASFPLRVTQQGMKAHPGEVHAEATVSRMLLGEAMLAALQRRRQGTVQDGWREERVSLVLQRDLLAPPDHLLTLLEPDAELASILKSLAADAISATAEGDGAAVGAAGATGLSSSNTALPVGTGQPPVVQVAAAALLASRLVQAPGGPRVKLDWVVEEKARLLESVLLGVRQLAARGRLTHLAASSISGFVARALEDANAAAYPADATSLAECLRCLGGLPLVALAQLAAYVFQLVGRCFLGLPDLDPHAFKDLAGGDDLDAELLPGGDVQLSNRGLADLLGVPSSLLSSSSGSNGSAALTAGNSGSSSANVPSRQAAAAGSGGGSSSSTLALARQGSGAASSELALLPAGSGGDSAAAGTQLLQRGSQCLAAYAAGGGAESAAIATHERPSLVLRRQKRQEGPSPAEVLAALQQQTALTGILLDLKAWINDTGSEQVPLLNELQAFNQSLLGMPNGLAAVDPSRTEQLVKRVSEGMRPCMQALALAGHAWAALQMARQREMIKQAQEGDDKLGRQLRGADGTTLHLVESARAQLRVHSKIQKGTAAELERRLDDTASLAANNGAAFVSRHLEVFATRASLFLQAQRELQAQGTPPEVLADAAKDAALALGMLVKRGFDALRDVAGMVSQLDGLLDCCHIRTQLLLSELHSRCCVHPPSELLGLALREVLPLAWQQEWRREQDSSSERFIAELLAEEEAAAKQKEKKQAKAAKKKKKGGSGAPSEHPSAALAATSEAAGGSDGEGAPESWEELPISTAEVEAGEEGSATPQAYLRMLQQYEEEERRQQAEAARQVQRAQQAQQAQRAQQAQQGSGAAGEDGEPGSAGKGKRKKKKKKGGKGEQQGDASPTAELAGVQQEDSEEWQAVGKKGKKQQQQAQQQQALPPPPGLQRAPGPAAASGERAAQQLQPAPPAAQPSQDRQPAQGRVAQQPPPPQQQQQQWEQEMQRQAAQQAQQAQHAEQQARAAQQRERELRPHAQAFAPLPLPLALQPGQQAQQALQMQQESAQSPTAERRLSHDSGRRRSLSADAPSFVPGLPPGRAPSRGSSALPQLPDSLEPSPAASPPPPTVPATPEPPAAAPATDDTSDLFALLGLGPTAPSPERPGEYALGQQQGALQPPQPAIQPQLPQLAASQPLGLEPLGLGLGGMHHGLQHSSSAAALGAPSLFSQPFAPPLAHAAEPLASNTGLAVSAGFGASMLQQPLGLGAAPAPAVDPETLAAAAQAARLAGYARQPDSLQPHAALLHSHGQPAAALPGASSALFLQQQPQHLSAAAQHPAVGLQGPGGWGQPVPQPQPLASSPGEDDMDSMLLSLGVTTSSEAAAPSWGAPGTAEGSSLLHSPHQQPGGFGPLLEQPFGAAQPQQAAIQQPQQAQQAQQLAGAAAPGQEAGDLTFTGLQNETGEYNCFLNVIIQCLWRCTDFRHLVLSWSPAVTAHNPVARALHNLFLALAASAAQQHGAAGTAGSPVPVNPSELREALAALPNKLFQLGEMSDAGETLLSTFEKVREAHPAAATELDRIFGLQVREAVVCGDPRCAKTTHQHAYTQYFYNTRAAALRRAVAQAAEERRLGRLGPKTLGARLRKVEEQVYKSCDTDYGGCNKSYAVTTRLEEAPRVFSLQIAWDSNRASPVEIAETLAAVDETVCLQEVYPDSPASARRYALRSMVCYYGQHYQALVLVPEAGGWLMFDDTRVTRVGTWADVRRKCEAGRIQPSVLFYEAA